MKQSKLSLRLLSVLLTVAMLFTLLVPAVSAEPEADKAIEGEAPEVTELDPATLHVHKLGEIDEAEVSLTLIAIKDLIQNSTGYVLAWDTFLAGAAIDAHYQALQGLIAGTMTPEEFAVAMDEAVIAMYAE